MWHILIHPKKKSCYGMAFSLQWRYTLKSHSFAQGTFLTSLPEYQRKAMDSSETTSPPPCLAFLHNIIFWKVSCLTSLSQEILHLFWQHYLSSMSFSPGKPVWRGKIEITPPQLFVRVAMAKLHSNKTRDTDLHSRGNREKSSL